MAVKIKHCTVVGVIGQFCPLAILQHKSRRAIRIDELPGFGQNSDYLALISGVVNENIISDPVGSMLANQYGHTINDIDEHVVLEKDRGNAVASLEL